MILYHGTTSSISAAVPMLHLGTQKAAMQRLAEKASHAGGVIYAFEVDFDNLLEISDQSQRIHTIAGMVEEIEGMQKSALPGQPDGSDTDEHEGIMSFSEADELLTASRSEGGGVEEFTNFLKGLDIHALSYANAWEDAGQKSYIIVAVERARLLDCRRWAPGESAPYEEHEISPSF